MMMSRDSISREELRRATEPKRLSALLFLSAFILFAGWNSLQRRVPFERSFIDNWYGFYTDSFYPQLIALSGTTVEPMKKIRYIVPGRKVNVIRWKLDMLRRSGVNQFHIE
ncbi:MAG: hypothetical protein WBI14_09925 [Anaerolineaceae bacterium]